MQNIIHRSHFEAVQIPPCSLQDCKYQFGLIRNLRHLHHDQGVDHSPAVPPELAQHLLSALLRNWDRAHLRRWPAASAQVNFFRRHDSVARRFFGHYDNRLQPSRRHERLRRLGAL